MKINNECCCGCKTEKPDQIKDNCPVCNNEGISVSKVTVEHLVVDDYRNAVNGDQYKICMNEDCDVVYYNLDNEIKLVLCQPLGSLVKTRLLFVFLKAIHHRSFEQTKSSLVRK